MGRGCLPPPQEPHTTALGFSGLASPTPTPKLVPVPLVVVVVVVVILVVVVVVVAVVVVVVSVVIVTNTVHFSASEYNLRLRRGSVEH